MYNIISDYIENKVDSTNFNDFTAMAEDYKNQLIYDSLRAEFNAE